MGQKYWRHTANTRNDTFLIGNRLSQSWRIAVASARHWGLTASTAKTFIMKWFFCPLLAHA